MALDRIDNIGDTTTSVGTGTIELAAVAQTGALIFAGNATSGRTVRYDIRSADQSEWEIGEGVFTQGTPSTLTRVTVYKSSNAHALVNFSAGTKNVSMVITAKDHEKATGAEINTGTEVDKAVTPQSIADSFLGVQGGWSPLGACTYEGADAPSFTFSISADVTGILSVGMRIKLTQTTIKFFIITAVGAYTAGKTIITVYGGTDYTLANAAITLPYYSTQKAPFGFPLSPAKWTVEITDATARTQASPSANTWYNLGTTNSQISIPIGSWNVMFNALCYVERGTASGTQHVTLSTGNNSESDADMTVGQFVTIVGSTGIFTTRSKNLVLSSKTLFYLNAMFNATGATTMQFFNSSSKMIIRAICAYL